MQTSADPFASLPQASGVMGGRPLLSSFNISSSDRVAGRRVTFTLSFTPSAGGALAPGGKITLNYPSNFFAFDSLSPCSMWPCNHIRDPTPGVSIQPWGTPTATSASWWSWAGNTGTLAASTAVNLVFEGFTMGTPSAGGDITVQTSADPLVSLPQASGVLGFGASTGAFGGGEIVCTCVCMCRGVACLFLL